MSICRIRRHSNCTGEPRTRRGFTPREGSQGMPTASNSSTSGGRSRELATTHSRSSKVAMFQTNSPVSTMLRAVSFRRPSSRPLHTTSTVGGSQVTFWNWL